MIKLRKHYLVKFLTVASLLLGINAYANSDWQKDLSEYDPYPTEGVKWLRTIMHVHTKFSHDACTNLFKSQNKKLKERCVLQFREAFCRNHVDVVFTSDHSNNMSQTDFNDLLSPLPEDERLIEDDVIYEVIHRCKDGHKVHFLPGAENKLMPLALKHHPDLLEGTNTMHETYRSFSLAASENFKKTGSAMMAIPHSEEWSSDHIKSVNPDVMEIYNLHYDIMEAIDERDIPAIIKQFSRAIAFLIFPWLEPDLLFLAFLNENAIALKNWAAVNLERFLPGIAGSDIHQNYLSFRMYDGERVDGYRRGTRWFSNAVPIAGALSREKIIQALKQGRSQVIFEAFGTPKGHRAHIESGGSLYGPGDQLNLNAGKANFIVIAPDLTMLDSGAPSPRITLRILKATSEGWQVVAQEQAFQMKYEIKEPGVYRAEVRIKPKHLKPFLFGVGGLIKDQPWIYFNPIIVK